MFDVGHGCRVRDCILCQRSSESADPVLGEKVMLMWGHLEEDGVTVLGLIDFYCLGTMRRRWPGWKLAELRDHFANDAGELKKHLQWREVRAAACSSRATAVSTPKIPISCLHVVFVLPLSRLLRFLRFGNDKDPSPRMRLPILSKLGRKLRQLESRGSPDERRRGSTIRWISSSSCGTASLWP